MLQSTTFGDDFADYFNQFKTNPSTYWHTCIVTLEGLGPELIWVVEKVLGFGVHNGSNIA